jgi:hypothetical protein
MALLLRLTRDVRDGDVISKYDGRSLEEMRVVTEMYRV